MWPFCHRKKNITCRIVEEDSWLSEHHFMQNPSKRIKASRWNSGRICPEICRAKRSPRMLLTLPSWTSVPSFTSSKQGDSGSSTTRKTLQSIIRKICLCWCLCLVMLPSVRNMECLLFCNSPKIAPAGPTTSSRLIVKGMRRNIFRREMLRMILEPAPHFASMCMTSYWDDFLYIV